MGGVELFHQDNLFFFVLLITLLCKFEILKEPGLNPSGKYFAADRSKAVIFRIFIFVNCLCPPFLINL